MATNKSKVPSRSAKAAADGKATRGGKAAGRGNAAGSGAKTASGAKAASAKAASGAKAASSAKTASSAKAASSAGAAKPAALMERLERAVPEATCELAFTSAFELLIATILSAQSTDKMVNSVMPTLLARYPTPHALAAADQDEVELLVKRTGFFRNKAKAIRGAAQQLVEHHGGEVPRTLEELVALPGVARKTANVVLGTAFGIPSGIVVDTHVTRVSERLGLTTSKDPVRIEQELCAKFPRDSWVELAHRLVLHGRYTCLARTPLCSQCPLNELCPSRQAEPTGSWQARAVSEAERVARGFAASGAATDVAPL